MKKYLFLAALSLSLGGCITQTTLNDTLSQLTQRNYQSRDYKVASSSLFKVTVDTLSDEKYIIKYTDPKQGIITGQKIKDNLVIDLNALVKKESGGSSLRFNISMSKVSFFGGRNEAIDDEDYYKYLFTKVEKSIYLDKNLYNSKGNYRPNAYSRSYDSYQYDYKYNVIENYDNPNYNQYYAY